MIDYKGCSEVWIVFEGGLESSVNATIEIYNATSGEVEQVEVTIDPSDLETVPGQHGDDPLFKFNVHAHVGEPESGDSKILGVLSVDGFTIGGEGSTNDARCAQVPDDGNGANAPSEGANNSPFDTAFLVGWAGFFGLSLAAIRRWNR